MSGWKQASVEIVRAGRSLWKPRRHLGPAWFRSRIVDFDLWYIWGGEGWLRSRAGRRPIGKGAVIFFKPGVGYEVGQEDRHRLGVAFVHFNLRDKAGRRLTVEEAALPDFCMGAPDFVDALMARVEALYRAGMKDARLHGPALALAGELLRAALLEVDLALAHPDLRVEPTDPETDPPLQNSIVDYLRAHAGQRVSVRSMAADLGYSVDHFIRRIRKEAGHTPKQIMLQMRMREARRLLRKTNLSVSDVALAVGYESAFTFSRQFKRETGQSPTAYRRSSAD